VLSYCLICTHEQCIACHQADGAVSLPTNIEAGEVNDYFQMLAPQLRMWRVRAMRAGRARALAKAEAHHCSSALTLRSGFACRLSVSVCRASGVCAELPDDDGH